MVAPVHVSEKVGFGWGLFKSQFASAFGAKPSHFPTQLGVEFSDLLGAGFLILLLLAGQPLDVFSGSLELEDLLRCWFGGRRWLRSEAFEFLRNLGGALGVSDPDPVGQPSSVSLSELFQQL